MYVGSVLIWIRGDRMVLALSFRSGVQCLIAGTSWACHPIYGSAHQAVHKIRVGFFIFILRWVRAVVTFHAGTIVILGRSGDQSPKHGGSWPQA